MCNLLGVRTHRSQSSEISTYPMVNHLFQNDLNYTNVSTIWLFNIAMENPNHKWRYLARKIIYFYGPSIFHGELLVITCHNQVG